MLHILAVRLWNFHIIEKVYKARVTIIRSTRNMASTDQIEILRQVAVSFPMPFITKTTMERVKRRMAHTSSAGGRLSKMACPYRPR